VTAVAGFGLSACSGATTPHSVSSSTVPSGATTTVAPGTSTTIAAGGPPRPDVLVAVTAAGALVRLDPSTGSVVRTLVPTGVVGDEVAVSPDGSSAYFEVNQGCDHQLEQVATTGGDASVITTQGSLPAISPTGDVLAYAQQPLSFTAGCAPTGPDNGIDHWNLVTDNLSTKALKSLPMSPTARSNGLPYSISHLSWSADGSRLAVSIAAPEDDEGWAINLVDPANGSYYFGDQTPSVPLPAGQETAGWYWLEGVWQPDGNLFVVKQCCTGIPEKITSVELDQVNPTSGATVHMVATGLTSADHSSLSVDTSGRWLLYLSGGNLEVSHNGARPTQLASGFVAAAW
jgi:hypothetical protein